MSPLSVNEVWIYCRASRTADGVEIVAQFTAVLEQADDHTWSAYTLSPSLVIGTGTTKEEAVADLRSAMAFWIEYMKDTQQAIPGPATELVTFEVAA
jgi:predicted RNase H-like HicB family nuclease